MDDQPPYPLNPPFGSAGDPSLEPFASDYAAEIASEAAESSGPVSFAPVESHLIESVVYRPGVIVALVLLAGPAASAVAAAVVAGVSGSIPLWLPLILLLWLPLLALAWLLLKSVRVTPTALASGRPLGKWRIIPFEEIERVEQRWLTLVIGARSGPPVTIAPPLLFHGEELRRTLLLRLPLRVLWGRLRMEAQDLGAGDLSARAEGDITGVLTVRSRWLWSALAGGAALALLALAVATTIELSTAPGVALTIVEAGLALLFGYWCLWMMQEIFVSEKGLIIHYRLLRRERVVFWAQVRLIEYTPWELALLFSGVRRVACIGPGALSVSQARQMRQFISRYCLSQVAPLLARRPF